MKPILTEDGGSAAGMTESEFWIRVQSAFDQHQDPLDHPELTAWLVSHPETLDEFAATHAVHQELGIRSADSTKASLDGPEAKKRPAMIAFVFFAAAVLLALVLWPDPAEPNLADPIHEVAAEPAATETTSSTETAHAPASAVTRMAPSIQFFESRLVITSPDRRHTLVSDGYQVREQIEYFFPGSPGPN